MKTKSCRCNGAVIEGHDLRDGLQKLESSDCEFTTAKKHAERNKPLAEGSWDRPVMAAVIEPDEKKIPRSTDTYFESALGHP